MKRTDSSPSEADAERLLAEFSPDVARLARSLRAEILSAMPDAAERVYFGWRGIGFHDSRAGYVCAIFPREEDVRVGFERGYLLHDPGSLLVGDGRQVRYLVFEDDQDAGRLASLHDFIRQATEGL